MSKPSRPLATYDRVLLAKIAHKFVGLWHSDMSPQERGAVDLLVKEGYLSLIEDHIDSGRIIELTYKSDDLMRRVK